MGQMETSATMPILLLSTMTITSPLACRTIVRSTSARPMLGVVTPSSRLRQSAPRNILLA